MQINLPQEMTSVTLAAWVNINRLLKNDSDNHNSLLMSDYWQRSFATHWFMRTDGSIRFAMQNQEGNISGVGIGDGVGNLETMKTPQWTSALDHFGQWCMVATVYDPDAKSVTCYFNGRAVETEILTELPRVVFGPALIGAWNPSKERKTQDCVLDGRMDELMIFRSALSPEEILKIYEAGKP